MVTFTTMAMDRLELAPEALRISQRRLQHEVARSGFAEGAIAVKVKCVLKCWIKTWEHRHGLHPTTPAPPTPS